MLSTFCLDYVEILVTNKSAVTRSGFGTEFSGGFMFDFLFPNHPFGGHTLRLVAQAQQGGGDVFDIARAMKKRRSRRQRRLGACLVGTRAKDRDKSRESVGRRATWERRSNIFFTRATTTGCRTCSLRSPRNRSGANVFSKPGTISAPRSSFMNPKSKSSRCAAATKNTTVIFAIRSILNPVNGPRCSFSAAPTLTPKKFTSAANRCSTAVGRCCWSTRPGADHRFI